MTIDTEFYFHELMMDYRGASPLHAQEAYEKVVGTIDKHISSEVARRILVAMREIQALPPAYISMSQAGMGADAHGYVRGWNDCVDAVANKENK